MARWPTTALAAPFGAQVRALFRLGVFVVAALGWPPAAVAAAANIVPTSPAPGAAVDRPGRALPDVVLLTVDALRTDRLSAAGYDRPTTPEIDRLLAEGIRFTAARTVEPLTAPALISMLTSLEPDVHGATRNGVPMRRGLDSLTTRLAERGYRSAAFVTSWVLKDRMTGLASQFDVYREVLTRKRWWGLVGKEASAERANAEVLSWLERFKPQTPGRPPLLLWVHYIEPHAPYQNQKRFDDRLGVARFWPGAADRYDTEVAAVDAEIGKLVDVLRRPTSLGPDTLFVFAADHGESLGEHDYWGHGRNLFAETLRIPLGVVRPGRIRPGVVDAPASILDIAPTVLGQLDLPAPKMTGFDWSPVFAGAAPPERTLWIQAHEGVALGHRSDVAKRRHGLLEIGWLAHGRKQTWRPGDRQLRTYDLRHDPGEALNLTAGTTAPPAKIALHLQTTLARLSSVEEGAPLDAESIAALRALGYVE